MQISKGILQRIKSLRFLLSAILGELSINVAGTLLEKVRPDLPDGQTVPDFLASIRALGQRLRAAMDRLSNADMKVFFLKAELEALGKSRDTLASALAAAIVRLRRLVLGLYEAPHVAGLALQSPRSYRPTPLLRQADLITGIFAGELLASLLGEAAYEESPGLQEPVRLVQQIADELLAVTVEIDETRRQLDRAVIEKKELQEEYDMLFLNTARTFESYCRLAGMERLAKKIRPSKRRPGRTEVEPDEEELELLESVPAEGVPAESVPAETGDREVEVVARDAGVADGSDDAPASGRVLEFPGIWKGMCRPEDQKHLNLETGCFKVEHSPVEPDAVFQEGHFVVAE